MHVLLGKAVARVRRKRHINLHASTSAAAHRRPPRAAGRTLLYTLNHSGWWSFFSASSAVRVIKAKACAGNRGEGQKRRWRRRGAANGPLSSSEGYLGKVVELELLHDCVAAVGLGPAVKLGQRGRASVSLEQRHGSSDERCGAHASDIMILDSWILATRARRA